MCRRDAPDPLLQLLLERYHLHVLSVPRQSSRAGDLYVENSGAVSAPGNVEHLLTPRYALPQPSTEAMADISGNYTRNFSVGASLGFLESALAAMGAAPLVQSLKVSFQRQRVSSVRFAFEHVLRSSVDVLEIGTSIWRHHIDEHHALVDPDNRYYLVTATVSSDGMRLHAETEDGQDVAFGADLAHVADIGATASISRSGDTDVAVQGERLVFAVELHELVYDRRAANLKLRVARRPVSLRDPAQDVRAEPTAEPARLGGPDAPLLLAVSDVKRGVS